MLGSGGKSGREHREVWVAQRVLPKHRVDLANLLKGMKLGLPTTRMDRCVKAARIRKKRDGILHDAQLNYLQPFNLAVCLLERDCCGRLFNIITC